MYIEWGFLFGALGFSELKSTNWIIRIYNWFIFCQNGFDSITVLHFESRLKHLSAFLTGLSLHLLLESLVVFLLDL